jgi:hypothetical protein
MIRATSSECGEDRKASSPRSGTRTQPLMIQNNEELKMVRELLGHANSRITLDLYAQASMPNKSFGQCELVRLVFNKGEA